MTSKQSFRSSAALLGPQVICNLHCCRSVFWTIARCAVGIYTKVLQYGAKFRAGPALRPETCTSHIRPPVVLLLVL